MLTSNDDMENSLYMCMTTIRSLSQHLMTIFDSLDKADTDNCLQLNDTKPLMCDSTTTSSHLSSVEIVHPTANLMYTHSQYECCSNVLSTTPSTYTLLDDNAAINEISCQRFNPESSLEIYHRPIHRCDYPIYNPCLRIESLNGCKDTCQRFLDLIDENSKIPLIRSNKKSHSSQTKKSKFHHKISERFIKTKQLNKKKVLRKTKRKNRGKNVENNSESSTVTFTKANKESKNLRELKCDSSSNFESSVKITNTSVSEAGDKESSLSSDRKLTYSNQTKSHVIKDLQESKPIRRPLNNKACGKSNSKITNTIELTDREINTDEKMQGNPCFSNKTNTCTCTCENRKDFSKILKSKCSLETSYKQDFLITLLKAISCKDASLDETREKLKQILNDYTEVPFINCDADLVKYIPYLSDAICSYLNRFSQAQVDECECRCDKCCCAEFPGSEDRFCFNPNIVDNELEKLKSKELSNYERENTPVCLPNEELLRTLESGEIIPNCDDLNKDSLRNLEASPITCDQKKEYSHKLSCSVSIQKNIKKSSNTHSFKMNDCIGQNTCSLSGSISQKKCSLKNVESPGVSKSKDAPVISLTHGDIRSGLELTEEQQILLLHLINEKLTKRLGHQSILPQIDDKTQIQYSMNDNKINDLDLVEIKNKMATIDETIDKTLSDKNYSLPKSKEKSISVENSLKKNKLYKETRIIPRNLESSIDYLNNRTNLMEFIHGKHIFLQIQDGDIKVEIEVKLSNGSIETISLKNVDDKERLEHILANSIEEECRSYQSIPNTSDKSKLDCNQQILEKKLQSNILIESRNSNDSIQDQMIIRSNLPFKETNQKVPSDYHVTNIYLMDRERESKDSNESFSKNNLKSNYDSKPKSDRNSYETKKNRTHSEESKSEFPHTLSKEIHINKQDKDLQVNADLSAASAFNSPLSEENMEMSYNDKIDIGWPKSITTDLKSNHSNKSDTDKVSLKQIPEENQLKEAKKKRMHNMKKLQKELDKMSSLELTDSHNPHVKKPCPIAQVEMVIHHKIEDNKNENEKIIEHTTNDENTISEIQRNNESHNRFRRNFGIPKRSVVKCQAPIYVDDGIVRNRSINILSCSSSHTEKSGSTMSSSSSSTTEVEIETSRVRSNSNSFKVKQYSCIVDDDTCSNLHTNKHSNSTLKNRFVFVKTESMQKITKSVLSSCDSKINANSPKLNLMKYLSKPPIKHHKFMKSVTVCSKENIQRLDNTNLYFLSDIPSPNNFITQNSVVPALEVQTPEPMSKFYADVSIIISSESSDDHDTLQDSTLSETRSLDNTQQYILNPSKIHAKSILVDTNDNYDYVNDEEGDDDVDEDNKYDEEELEKDDISLSRFSGDVYNEELSTSLSNIKTWKMNYNLSCFSNRFV